MWAYLILFTFPALAAIGGKFKVGRAQAWSLPLVFYALLFLLLVGLRHDVGGDWGNYVLAVDTAEGTGFWEHVSSGWDPGYEALNWLAAQLGLGVYFVNIACAAFFLFGLLRFASARSAPWLAVTVAIPYLTIVVLMGYSRQGVAIGFALLALTELQSRKFLTFFAWLMVAALFHKTAVILAPIAMFSASTSRVKQVFWSTCFTITAVALFIAEPLEGLYESYSAGSYESSGAAIRIATNAVPALVFLLYRRRFKLPDDVRKTWTLLAVSALVFIPLLASPLSSTILDRLALYWIPLQLFVFSELPAAFARNGVPSQKVRALVIIYSSCLLIGWLLFANHAEYWLTYQFLPFL